MAKRTLAQNASVHVYCRLRAESFNNAGYTLDDLSGDVQVPANKHMVEEYLWKPQNPNTEITKVHRHCFEFMANLFLDFGIDFRMIVPDGTVILWDTYTVKECIWRPVQIQILGIESTRDLDIGDPGIIHETVERYLLYKYDRLDPIEFPHEEKPDKIEYPDDEPEIDAIPF